MAENKGKNGFMLAGMPDIISGNKLAMKIMGFLMSDDVVLSMEDIGDTLANRRVLESLELADIVKRSRSEGEFVYVINPNWAKRGLSDLFNAIVSTNKLGYAYALEVLVELCKHNDDLSHADIILKISQQYRCNPETVANSILLLKFLGIIEEKRGETDFFYAVVPEWREKIKG